MTTIENSLLTSNIELNLLKSQLITEREKLFSQINLLIQTELSYENVLLHIDYDHLLINYNQLNNEYQLLKDKYQQLSYAGLYLINKTQDLIEERNKYYNEWNRNKGYLTPRPDWNKVANVIDGGYQRWKVLSTNKTSEQLVEILIREIVNGNQSELIDEPDEFRAIGDDLTVLSFLRMKKYTSIVNRKVRRRITGILIKEIWMDKLKNSFDPRIRDLTRTQEEISSLEDSKQTSKTLADHVANYFEKRFDSKTIGIEMGYNLYDACQRYRNSEQINLFWGILTGQIEEMIYHYQMKSISQLHQHLIRINTLFTYHRQIASSTSKERKSIVNEPNSRSSILANHRLSSLSLLSMKDYQEFTDSPKNRVFTNEEFVESLKLFYPTKTPTQIDELFQSAKHDLPYSSQSIEFELLFHEDDEGRFGEFLSTLIKQIQEEKIVYVEQIKQILLGYPLITVSQFSRAIYMIDSKIPQNELHRYIEWIYSIKNYHSSQQIKPLDLEILLKRLENCACFKH